MLTGESVTMRMLLSLGVALLAVGVLSAQSPATVQSGPDRPLRQELFEAYTRSHQEKHDLEREALTRARETTNLRLDEMNNLRTQINQERGTYVTRLQYEAMSDRLNKIEQTQSSMQGANVAYVVAVGIFFTIVQIVLRFVVPTPARKVSE